MDDETIEDVRAAYALLYSDMAALRVKADALADALDSCIAHGVMTGADWVEEKARTAIANYTGA